MNPNLSLYSRVIKVNKTSDECSKYRTALTQNKKKFKEVKLITCTIKHEVLYYDSRVWIPNDVQLLVNLIRKSHNPPMCEHSNALRTLQIIDQYYY